MVNVLAVLALTLGIAHWLITFGPWQIRVAVFFTMLITQIALMMVAGVPTWAMVLLSLVVGVLEIPELRDGKRSASSEITPIVFALLMIGTLIQ